MNFNPAQETAVNAREGAYQVLAGPGSGKTSCLVARYKALLNEGVASHDILSLTFTKKSAEEMKKRAGIKSETRAGQRPYGFCTFHSLALSFADLERDAFPFQLAPFPLAAPGVVAKSASVAIRRFCPNVKFKTFLNYISLLKRAGQSPETAFKSAEDDSQRNLALAYIEHDKYLRQQGLMDFDSLMADMGEVLSRSEQVRTRWQYRYVMQDESQDADLTQWNVLKCISEKHGNVFCVGDGNQAIYAWRGAHPEIFISKFSDFFPAARPIYLGVNYRSTLQIVALIKEAAPVRNELIDHFSTSNPAGVAPAVEEYSDQNAEAANVAAEIKAALMMAPKETFALLARTNGYLRPFEEMLSQDEIKYRLLGKAGYWQQSEVKSALAFIQCAAFPTDAAVLAALRSPFPCTKYIRKKELIAEIGSKGTWNNLQHLNHANAQQQRAINSFIGKLQALRRFANTPAAEAVPQIIQDIGAIQYYADEEVSVEADNDPAQNLTQLGKVAKNFDSLGDFLNFSRKVSGASRNRTGVALGTVHAAKGLEWDHVFLVGASEGVLPHKNSENIDEEARIYFVAISRAAKSLHISYTGQPSRFIKKAAINKTPNDFQDDVFSLLG